jgi:hypothetical protein
MHPSTSGTYSLGTNTWTLSNGWLPVPGAGFNSIYHETSIDLSGYAMEDLTFFPAAVGLQDPGLYLLKVAEGAPDSGMQVLDIITSVPMDLDDVARTQQYLGNAGPGMIGSDYDFETIIFGMYRWFALNTNIPFPNYHQLERSQRFDSGEPNASDKLFCYRIVTFTTGGFDDNSLVSIPAARQLIGGAMDAEAELVYMQRLARSYELANQV